MPHIKVNDISMYYEIHGQGEPIVFIGGFTADHVVWNATLSYFKDYQVILFDNRGAGQTDVPEGPYSIEQMADDVAALCESLGILRAHFVGNSMGGFILQTLIMRHRDLVKSATLSNSVLTPRAPFQIYLEALRELRNSNASEEVLIKMACSWFFSYQFISQPGMLEVLTQMGLKNPYPVTDKGFDAQYAALQKFDSSSWAQKINVPTLVLAGDQDLVFRETLVKQLAANIPNARYYCFSDCGHLPQIEYPEKFAELVDMFIKSLD